MATHIDFITAARLYGRDRYRLPGEHFFPELATNVLCCLIERKGGLLEPNGQPYRGRGRRHSFLMAPSGFSKSKELMDMMDILGAQSIFTAEDDFDGLTYACITGDTTWESLRGGYQEGQYLLPALPRIDFLIAEEALAFFGSTLDSIMTMSKRLDDPLESGNVVFAQKQAVAAKPHVKETFRAECEEHGIQFDTRTGSFAYRCRFNAIFCSHRPNHRQWTVMTEDGILSRFSIEEVDPSNEQFRDYMADQFGEDHLDFRDALAKYARLARDATIEDLRRPPDDVISRIINFAIDEYGRISEDTGIDLHRFYPARNLQNVVQGLVAEAFSEALAAYGPDWSEPITIPALHYSPTVIENVIQRQRAQIAATRFRLEQVDERDIVLMEASNFLRQYCKHAKETEDQIAKEMRFGSEAEHEEYLTRPKPHEFIVRKHFVNYLREKNVPSPTNRIARLQKHGHLRQLEPHVARSLEGFDLNSRDIVYQVSRRLLSSIGLRSRQQVIDSLDPSNLQTYDEMEDFETMLAPEG